MSQAAPEREKLTTPWLWATHPVSGDHEIVNIDTGARIFLSGPVPNTGDTEWKLILHHQGLHALGRYADESAAMDALDTAAQQLSVKTLG